MAPTLQNLIKFNGDQYEVIPWSAFTNATANALRRLFQKASVNDDWKKGVAFDSLKNFSFTDLTDTKHVGALRAKQILSELTHSFELIERGHKFLDDDALLTDLITYRGDFDLTVMWDNFPTTVAHSLQRMLMRLSLDDTWNVGLKYSNLEGLRLTDIHETPAVGVGKAQAILDELYRVFSTLEVEGPSSSVATLEELETTPYFGRINEATNFEELVLGIYFAFHEIHPINDRTSAILNGRHQLFADQMRTLDEIGAEWGVTRERIRQIEVKYASITLSSESKNSVLPALVDILENSNSEADFVESSSASNLVGSIKLSISKLKAALEILGMEELYARVIEAEAAWQEHDAAQDALVAKVQKYRTKLGLLDLGVFAGDIETSEERAFALVCDAYPRSIRYGKLVLARTTKLDTTFENVIGKQLLVFEDMSASDLLVGVERHASYRNYPVIGAQEEQLGLIKAVCGDNPTYVAYEKNAQELPELNDTDLWLLELFRSSPTGVLHRNEVTEAALKDQKNVATINVFLLYNPLLRSVGSAVMALANCKVDPVTADKYARIARAAVEPTELEWEFSGSNILIKFTPNLNMMAAGVLFPSNDLRDMIKEIAFDVSCECKGMESEQQLRLRPPSFWTGFTAAIRHLTTEHYFVKGESIKMILDFDNHKAEIKM
jgi:hypothetical protein